MGFPPLADTSPAGNNNNNNNNNSNDNRSNNKLSKNNRNNTNNNNNITMHFAKVVFRRWLILVQLASSQVQGFPFIRNMCVSGICCKDFPLQWLSAVG